MGAQPFLLVAAPLALRFRCGIWARKLLPVPWRLSGPGRYASTNFKAADLQLQMTQEPQKKPSPSDPLVFGKTFTDHMLMVEWDRKKGWGWPRIQPFQNLILHPACSALHYSLQLFEGMKAFKGADQQVRLFRPWLNMDRMLRTALRLCLPSFDKVELLECIRRLIEVDKAWVPERVGTSLYVRPVLMGNEDSLGVSSATRALLYVILCPVGSYFPGDSVTPVSLLADPTFIRAWMGGVGDYKMGGNYGPTVLLQQEAQKKGCEQVLWLYGPDHHLTEVGTMNIFVYWTHEDGVLELVTPPLDGIILPGVVRQSLLDLARTWGEFRVVERKITMKELLQALEEGRVREVFGSGTACQVCPVHRILYEDKHLHIPTMENGPELTLRFQKELKAIQYGTKAHEWMLPV
ncbi:branched-chain-amino-acid aminotransferase, mitochondrial isoform X2 [Sciurus carolinensis]|uniref:branched-chain-amino-acid aminotransferase, mitochondrial isoform X2 n=1 Tax=Sciurus carolinensis TaxID=30640 RepID=UPI001FB37337|nr:branched-chain-amino-acid aminotransferase, mitochondrial isoform X2 [Sciurus carolinensis]